MSGLIPRRLVPRVAGQAYRFANRRTVLATAALLIPALLLISLPLGIISDNEEAAFYRALARVQPRLLTEQFALLQSSNARWLSEIVFGYSSRWLGVETAVALFRLIAIAGLSFGLAYLTSGLKLRAISAAVGVAAFVLMGQQLIGGEWIFGSVESKVIAYSLVFFGIGATVRGRHVSSDLLMVAGTYFHFLVGGFWMVFLLLFQLFRGGTTRILLVRLARYSVLVLPLAAALFMEQILGHGDGSGLTNAAARIYAEERNGAHVSPFASLLRFWGWTDGIVLCMAALSMLWFARHSLRNRTHRAFVTATCAALLYLLLALFVSWLDRDTHYLAVFFLFRPSSLALLLAVLCALLCLDRYERHSPRVLWALGLVALPVFGWSEIKERVDDLRTTRPALEKLREVAGAVRAASTPGDVVLIDPGLEPGEPGASLMRLVDRPTYVSWKIMPHRSEAILEWNRRMSLRQNIFTDGCSARAFDTVNFEILVGDDSTNPSIFSECTRPVMVSGRHWVLKKIAGDGNGHGTTR